MSTHRSRRVRGRCPVALLLLWIGVLHGFALGDSVDVGSFTKSTGGAPVSQVVPHGLGETPEVIILWTVAETDESFSSDVYRSFGASDGTTEYSFGGASEDNATPDRVSRGSTKIVSIVDWTATVLAEADLTAWDSDDFTLNWTTNNATAYRIHYIAIGGAGVSASVVNWADSGSTGNQSITGAGFQPDVLIHFWAASVSTITSTVNHIDLGMGVMDASGDEWALSMYGLNNSTSPVERGQQTDAGVYDSALPGSLRKATLVSMDTDGFTINWSSAGAAGFENATICLSGLNAKAGSFNKSTSGAPASQSITGVGFEPDLLLIASFQDTSQSFGSTHCRWGFGATDGTTEGCSATVDRSGVNPAQADRIDKTSKVFVKVDNTSTTIDAEADLTSMDSDGFTLNWTTNDGVATEICYLALVPFSAISVRIADVQVVDDSTGVGLDWRTSKEIDNLGFHVYREMGFRRVRVTATPIPGSTISTGSRFTIATGDRYSAFDPNGSQGDRYWIEDIDLSGVRHQHGPFVAGGGSAAAIATRPDGSEGSLFTGDQSVMVPSQRRESTEDSRDPDVEQWLAASSALVIGVAEEGVYRVTQEDWVGTGLPEGVDPRRFRLYVRGEELPIELVGAQDGSFDPGDSVLFFGLGNSNPYDAETRYWLVEHGGTPKRITKKSGSDDGFAASTCYPEVWIHEKKLNYFPALRNGPASNFFGELLTADSLRFPISLPICAPYSGSPTLVLTVQGIGSGGHSVVVLADGVPIGELSWFGNTEATVTIDLSSVATIGDFELSLMTGGVADFSFLKSFSIAAPQSFIAGEDPWFFSVPGDRVAIVQAVPPGTRFFDVTNPSRIADLGSQLDDSATSERTRRVPCPGLSTRRILAFGNAGSARSLRRNSPSDWRRRTEGAEFVIMGPAAFHSALRPLIQLRRNEGLSTQWVNLEDVYDEYSGGACTPWAIAEFLKVASERWTNPPRYLLLVGEATTDPRSYRSPAPQNVVPTFLIDSAHIETASDARFGDVDGDGFGEIAVGRFPVRSEAELESLVSKTVGYALQSANQRAYRELAIGVADTDDNFSFTDSVTRVSAAVPALSWVVRDRNAMSLDRLSATLQSDFDEGPGIVAFFGHGGTQCWSVGSVWDSTRAFATGNAHRNPIVGIASCLNGYFHHPTAECLAESWLEAPEGGAVAVLASSDFANPYSQRDLTIAWIQSLSSEKPPRIGDALLGAQFRGDPVARATTVLLGDPTLRFVR